MSPPVLGALRSMLLLVSSANGQVIVSAQVICRQL
jgi:hypothetical protein